MALPRLPRVLCCPFMSDRPGRWPPPWLFLPLILPGGVYSGFVITALPFLLGQAQVTLVATTKVKEKTITVESLPVTLQVAMP